MRDYYWTLRVQGRKYDPSQPRVPAGDPRGGRWTSGVSEGIQYIPSQKVSSKATEIADESIRQYALYMGMTTEEAEAELLSQLKKDVENPVSIHRTAGSTVAILEEGRFKTQFETGTSGGTFDPEYRSKAEQNGLGYPYPEQTGLENRPVYGAISLPDTLKYNLRYGEVEWVLRDEVKKRATVTVGDSLFEFSNGQLVGTPVSSPGKESLDQRAMAYSRGAGRSPVVEYLEVQIQGGVSLADVSRIVLHHDRWGLGIDDQQAQIIKQMAAERGIDVEDRRGS